jgi:DnaK suppressor protein
LRRGLTSAAGVRTLKTGAFLLRWSFAEAVRGGPLQGRFLENASMNYSPFKEALLRKRGEILSMGGGVKPLPATIEVNSRQGDLADQASGNNEVHIQLKLKQTDAKILQAIEEALYRMEKGTYGICRDCGEEIAEPRLNAIPWTRVCIKCKEKQSS